MYSSKVHLLCFSLPSPFLLPSYDGTKNPSQTSVRKGFHVPRPGLEPGWVAPLVFETSASTDSAIWASKAGAKIRISEQITK